MAEIVLKSMSWSHYCDICGHDVFVNEHNPACVRCRSTDTVLKSETQWIVFIGGGGRRIWRKVTC